VAKKEKYKMPQILFKSKSERKVILITILLMVVFVIFDHVTKYLIVKDITLLYRPIKVIPGFFNIVSVRNTGAAFGMFHGNNLILFLVAFAAFILLCFCYRSITEGWAERYYALGLILSGIIGNALDRVLRHSVVDFLDFSFGTYHWPSFNVADSAICIGVFVLLLSFLFRPTAEKLKKNNEK
jgi:signal peptidase II